MAARLKRIFDLDKVTYDLPGESHEQEGLFIAVDKAHCKTVESRQIAKVEGKITVYAESGKMPFGYLAKKLAKSEIEDVRGFFFGPEENEGTFMSLVKRSFAFTFLFDSQYDPAIGSITSITTTVTET
jgi:hypothetical protein